MTWDVTRGRCQRTTNGTTKAHLYYYVLKLGVRHYVAGRHFFGQEIEYGRISFTTPAQARKYCENKDRDTVVLTSQS